MRAKDEDTQVAEYWDDYFSDFGLPAYIQARYIEGLEEMDRSREGKGAIIYSFTRPCDMCGEVHLI